MTPRADERFDRIRHFVTNTGRPVYCLKNLPEEVVAVLFAYYSRSRETLRDNLLKLVEEDDLDLGAAPGGDGAAAGGTSAAGGEGAVDTVRLREAREKARAFHEKWVVGYGHSSVAEHAVVHVAVEGISILAGKVVEDTRLASFTEKSTRYVPFDTTQYHRPAAIARSGAASAMFEEGIRAVMTTYDALMEPLVAHLEKTNPLRPGQTERARQAACRAQACDVLRYLLPAATHTNVGMTINARSLEGLLVKMLSHPLDEVNEYGRLIREEAGQIVPTLIKYADRSEYRTSVETRVREQLADLPAAPHPFSGAPISTGEISRARLIRFDPDAEDRVIEAILYPVAGLPAAEIAKTVSQLPSESRGRILDSYLSGRGNHDAPLRALEETRYTFEIVADFGAYRDIQRHRMATQHAQPLTTDLGYERPAELAGAGMADAFDRAMEAAAESHRRLVSEFPAEAQYVVPLAFRKRFLMTMNLRELHHFVPLRSGRQGHPSYRRLAQEIFREVARVHPGLASGIRVDLADYSLSRG